MIKLKRAYDPESPEDGTRILVDRMWPRGIRKEALKLDSWAKELAPSSELRQWFNHDPVKWDEFKRRYFAELDTHAEDVRLLLDGLKGRDVTLLYSAADTAHNNALALKEYIESKLLNS